MPIFTVTKPAIDIDQMGTHQQALCFPGSALDTSSDHPLSVGTQGCPVSLPTTNTIMIVPDLQRRPKIRRTGEYDDLYIVPS